MSAPTVFVSYSHKDEGWKDRLVTHLGVLEREGALSVWDDRRIVAGADWYPEIADALDGASVALLLVSADFLTSNFILGEEVPRLLERRRREGLRVIPVILRPCAWDRVGWLRSIQARPKDGRPLSPMNEAQADAALADLAREVADLIVGRRPSTGSTAASAGSGPPEWDPLRVSIEPPTAERKGDKWLNLTVGNPNSQAVDGCYGKILDFAALSAIDSGVRLPRPGHKMPWRSWSGRLAEARTIPARDSDVLDLAMTPGTSDCFYVPLFDRSLFGPLPIGRFRCLVRVGSETEGSLPETVVSVEIAYGGGRDLSGHIDLIMS